MRFPRTMVVATTGLILVLAGAGITRRIHAQGSGLTVGQRVILESYVGGSTALTSKRMFAYSIEGMALIERDPDTYPKVPGYHYRLLSMTDGRLIHVYDPIRTKTTYYMQ